MKKRLLAFLLAFSCTFGSAITALAAEANQVITPDTVLPYSEDEDPLAERMNNSAPEEPDSDTAFTSEFDAHNSGSKKSQYSFLTKKNYYVPSGYQVYHGIDVSRWQDTINWKKVKNAGVDFAFVRIGGRYTGSGALFEDPTFRRNVTGAANAGIPVGVYLFSQALTPAEARAEANFILGRIKGYHLTMPIVMDYEFAGDSARLNRARLSRKQMTENALAFCSVIRQAGYQPMVYANKSFLEDNLYAGQVSKTAPIWLAHYTTSTNYSGEYDFWQYSEYGHVDGISSYDRVDCNFLLTKGGLPSKSNTIHGFTDVLSDDWFAGAVSFVADHSLMNGTSRTTFAPNMPLNRVMAAQILYNLSGRPAVSYFDAFPDVPSGAWYTNAVIWAKKQGIMSGYPDGRFGSEDCITREQIATILYHYSRKYGGNACKPADISGFADVASVSDYAVSAMQWAVAAGIISGRANSDSTVLLAPQAFTTRAECAAVLKSYLTGVGASLLS